MITIDPNGFLAQSAIYLGAAAICVPVFQRLKLGSIVGFLVAGVALGPYGLNLLRREEGVFHIAELGVVLFLFVIGLEVSFVRLWAMRKDIFGVGLVQMLVTGAAIGGVLSFAGYMNTAAAVIAGFALAGSSTAFALQLLRDRGELNSPHGRTAFSILLFQDLAVIPLLAVIPFLAGRGAAAAAGPETALAAIGVLAALVVTGRYLLNPAFRIVARAGSHEAFAAAALFVVAATALAVSSVGLSMALGAFLAGMLLADSAFRHQIETDIEPFRGILLGLFFINVGMSVDMSLVARNWLLVIAAAAGLVALKAAALVFIARAFGKSWEESMRAAVVLSQGGEFAFVAFSLGVGGTLFTSNEATLMAAIVTLSMAMTPPLVSGCNALLSKRGAEIRESDRIHAVTGDALVVGFGRVGQIVSQILGGSGLSVTAIDKDTERIRMAEKFGFKVYYGDGARLDLLLNAGALNAHVVALCMDDREGVIQAVKRLRERCPKVAIIARAYDRIHELEMIDLGADHIVRETLESGVLMARLALEKAGCAGGWIDDVIAEYRDRDAERLFAERGGGAEAARELLHLPFRAAGANREKRSD